MDSHRLPPRSHSYARVLFRLEKDEDGYPPFDSETICATRIEDGKFKLDNIPFYARGVSCGDIVAAEPTERGPLKFTMMVRPSLHSTIRVILTKNCSDRRPQEERVSELRKKLQEIGCDTEASHPGFFAIDVPPTVRLSAVRAVLVPGFEAGLWDFEEATLWHTDESAADG